MTERRTAQHPKDETFCPFCGQRMLLRLGVRLSPRLADIFDMVVHGGGYGVPMRQLMLVFYPERSDRDAANCVRANITHINDRLAETSYRICRTGRHWDAPYRLQKEES